MITDFSVLDLFCCQGGASRGYELSGAAVYGVDLEPQPRYPYAFVQADAIQFVYGHADWIRQNISFVHASPPCQRYTVMQVIHDNDHPDLIDPTREALEWLGIPYVIENVAGARSEMIDPVELCGAMFGLHTYRHRLFEPGQDFTFQAPAHIPHPETCIQLGRRITPGDYYHAVGNFSGVSVVRDDWNVPWMNRDGVREAIPPAYTRWIGEQFLAWRPTDPAGAPLP